MGDRKLGAVLGMKARSIDREVDALMMRLDSFLCAASTQKRDCATNQLLNNDLRKEESNLAARTAAFVDTCTDYIVDNASRSISRVEAEEIKRNLKELDPFIATELLLAINYTKDISAITSREFIGNLGQLDKYVASALLYEIRLTGNETALTDARIFEDGASRFFNKLGPEAASEWFNSIGRTGNVAALTSEMALSDGVLNAVSENAGVVSELSYAIGTTGKTKMLTGTEFLKVLKGLDSTIATEYLSAIWCTKRVDELTNADIARKISSGEADIWKDIVRMFNGDSQNATKVLISKAQGDTHDRGVKLIVQSLINSGFDVIYAANVKNHEELVNIALEEKVHAIGFSVAGDGAQSMITGAIADAKIKGLNDISFFAGGMINPQLAEILERRGAKLFMPGYGQGELLNFLNSSRSSKIGQGAFLTPGLMQMYLSGSEPIQGSAIRGETAASTDIQAKPYTFLMELIMRLNGAPIVPFWLTNPALYPSPNIGSQQQAVFNSTMALASGAIASRIQARDEMVQGIAPIAVTVQNAKATVKGVGRGADYSMPFLINLSDPVSGTFSNGSSEASSLSGIIHPKVGVAVQRMSLHQVSSPWVLAGQHSRDDGFGAIVPGVLQRPASSKSVCANMPKDGACMDLFAGQLQYGQATPSAATSNAPRISSNQIQFTSIVFDGKNQNGTLAIVQNLLQAETNTPSPMPIQKSWESSYHLKNATGSKSQPGAPALGIYQQQISVPTILAKRRPAILIKDEGIALQGGHAASVEPQNIAAKPQEPKYGAVDTDAKILEGQATFFLDFISMLSASKIDRSTTGRITMPESEAPTAFIQKANSEHYAIKSHKIPISKSDELGIHSLTITAASRIQKSKAGNANPSNITEEGLATSILLSKTERHADYGQAVFKGIATMDRPIVVHSPSNANVAQIVQNTSGDQTVTLSLIGSPAKQACGSVKIADIRDVGLIRKFPEPYDNSALLAHPKAANGNNEAQKANDPLVPVEVKKHIALQAIGQDERAHWSPAGIPSSPGNFEGAQRMAIARAGHYRGDGIGQLRRIMKAIADAINRLILPAD